MFNINNHKNLYVITVQNGVSTIIPNAKHIERCDESIEELGIDRKFSDFDAAQLAKKDGIKLIDDIKGIYKDFYIDTKQNRKVICDFMNENPQMVGRELIGRY